MRDAVRVGAPALQRFAEQVLLALGADPEAAAESARHLVRANLSGHDSHGVLRLTQYVGEADRGELRPASRPAVLRECGAAALFDAGRGLGHFSTMAAATWVLERARREGLAAAAIRHSMHIGRLGEYTERLAEAGLVGVCTVGQAGPGAATVAPFHGSSRFLGTNPWSIGVPAQGRPPMIFDAATSTVAEGKVRNALARGEEVPPGTVRDPEGRPTLDPSQLYAGGTQTVVGGDVAGHKGYGLSLAAALVGGLAMAGDEDPTGAGTGRFPAAGTPRIAGVFLAAIDPAAFGEAALYGRLVAEVLDAAAASPPVPGVERVLVPGDPERASRGRREHEGVPVPAATWRDLGELAARFQLELPGAEAA